MIPAGRQPGCWAHGAWGERREGEAGRLSVSEVMRSACPKIVRRKSEAEVVKGQLSWAQMETNGRVGLWRRCAGAPHGEVGPRAWGALRTAGQAPGYVLTPETTRD